MGNKQQASEYGGMIIRTDKPFYFAGEVVTGNIYLNVTKEGFPGQIIQLKVKGKEHSYWQEERTESVQEADGTYTSQTYYETFVGNRQFYQHKTELYTFQTSVLPVGQFVFPFSFELYSYLPGSFNEKGGSYSASISYFVKAEIKSLNKKIKNMKHTQEFIVREPIKTNVAAALNGELKVNVTTCCCIKKGTTYIKCVFDKNQYLPGETAYLQIDLDNSNCKLDIEYVKATFISLLNLKSDRGDEARFGQTYATQKIQGVKAGVKAIEKNRKQMQLPIKNQKKSEDINPSTNGYIVKSQYYLQVKVKLDGCTCCDQDPLIEVPIQIVPLVPQIYIEPIPYPPNWNPQVFQPQILEFSQKTIYQKDQQQLPNFNYPPPPPPEQNQFGQMIKPMS